MALLSRIFSNISNAEAFYVIQSLLPQKNLVVFICGIDRDVFVAQRYSQIYCDSLDAEVAGTQFVFNITPSLESDGGFNFKDVKFPNSQLIHLEYEVVYAFAHVNFLAGIYYSPFWKIVIVCDADIFCSADFNNQA